MLNLSIPGRSDGKLVSLGLLLLGLLLPLQASSDDPSWYLGVSGVGKVFVDRDVSGFNDGSLTSGKVDDKDSGWKLFGGYRINKYFAVELGWTDLNNDFDSETSFAGQSSGMGSSYAPGEVTVDVDEPIAKYLAITGRLPLPLGPAPYNDRLSLIGKFGVTAWEATHTTIDSISKVETHKSGSDTVSGLALEYQWPNGIAIRSEYEFYKNIVGEDYEFLSLGVTYDF